MTETAKPSDPAKWYKLDETGQEYAAAQRVINFSGKIIPHIDEVHGLRKTLGLDFPVGQDSEVVRAHSKDGSGLSEHYPSVHQSSSPSDQGALYMRCPIGTDFRGNTDVSFKPADAREVTGEELNFLGQKVVYPPVIGISPTKKAQQISEPEAFALTI